MIDKNSIEQLKNRIDIVDVIGSYIELKKSGANYKALCPFHDEDTPSFVVSPSKQIFHCFGCGAGGDAIKFVMEYEKLTYPEAIEKLASMYNIYLRYTDKENRGKDLYKILDKVNSFFKKMLDKNKKAKEYLNKRGVFESSIEKFEIGYAPSSSEIISYLKSNFIPLNDAIEAGVLAIDKDRVYSRFIERVTFPIYSPNAKIVGFGGRTITGHPAKYINSPQSSIFNKSKLLYGYHLAKEKIYKTKRVIVTEGYLDVVMLHQAGFNNAVATLGTALTKEHLPLLRRGEPEIIVAYDADSAGVEAAIKAAKLLSISGFEGGVVLFKEGLDPADMVKNGEINELKKLLQEPKPFIEFVLERAVLKHNIKDPLQKEKALNEIKEYLKNLSPLLQDEYKNYAAALLNLPLSRIDFKSSKVFKNGKKEYKDIKELSIIKTLLNEPKLISYVLDYIDKDFFNFHKEEFELLLKEDFQNPKLLKILVDDEIKIYDENVLKKELLIFLIKFHEQKLKNIIKDKALSFEEKSFKIRKYKDIIKRLKQGELAVYE